MAEEVLPPTIGVVWDINTCPVPDDMDPFLVRQCIIAALEKYSNGPCRIFIYAVGNLDNVSSNMLRQLCSYGIFLRHSVFRMFDNFHLVMEMTAHHPDMTTLLVITGDVSWQYPYNNHDRLAILCAYSKHLHPVSRSSYNCDQEWEWEDLLEEYSRNLKKIGRKRKQTIARTGMIDVEYALSCILCESQCSNQRIDDFINHLKIDEKHKLKYLNSVFIDKDDRPFLFCEYCKYPGYDDHNMKIHLKSSEHKDLLYKTCPDCKFCNFTSDDMAFHYNSEEHIDTEIAFVLDDARCRKLKAEEEDEEEYMQKVADARMAVAVAKKKNSEEDSEEEKDFLSLVSNPLEDLLA